MLVYLLRRYRIQHENHLDYYVKHPDQRPSWADDLDSQVRLKLATINAAIARRLPIKGDM